MLIADRNVGEDYFPYLGRYGMGNFDIAAWNPFKTSVGEATASEAAMRQRVTSRMLKTVLCKAATNESPRRTLCWYVEDLCDVRT